MGMQVSCSIHPEVSTQGDLWVDTARARADHKGIGATEGEPSGGGASDGRSCSYHAVGAAEVLGVWGGGVHQGEERDSDRPTVHGPEEKLCGAELLGEGILCVDGRERRSAGTRLYQGTGERRPSARSTKDVRVTRMPA